MTIIHLEVVLMVKYFNMLENRKEFFLALINNQKREEIYSFNCNIPNSYIKKYSNLFEKTEFLIDIYKNFDINQWFDKNVYINYEKVCSVLNEFENIKEEIDWILEDYKKIDFTSKAIQDYLYLIKRLSYIYMDLFPNERDFYALLNKTILEAIEELKIISTVKCKSNKGVNIYQPDAWYITPNNYLYNAGEDGHKSRDLTFNYNRLVRLIVNNEIDLSNHDISSSYFNELEEIKENGYITASQFKVYLNYISQPVYLNSVSGMPITMDKRTIKLVSGIINAQQYFYKFFEDLFINTKSPISEINKIMKWTKNDIGDILVRCCGFHKIESMLEKTITTSCVDYEIQFEEYIKKGWKIQFVSPIIINQKLGEVEKYNNDFIVIRKVLKNLM